MPSVLCFCHLRWNFVHQRPQHLMTRMHRRAGVHLWEEPIYDDVPRPSLRRSVGRGGVPVLTPYLPHGMDAAASVQAQRALLDRYIADEGLRHFISWYYTPMALLFSGHLKPDCVVYDCMDELSAFDGAPPELVALETRLFAVADVIFTGGASLFASKQKHHGNVHLAASSIDREHFAAARNGLADPADQASIPLPRIGFFGVLDERLDRDLLRTLAAARPAWQFVLIGPVVKIAAHDLPRAANLHYLGQKDYDDLPGYLANWQVAMLPFAQNASTRFISPTKTPEYLAAGKPVVSTPIHDVVHPYGDLGLVQIGADAASFGAAIEACLCIEENEQWLTSVDKHLAKSSWDELFERMWKEVQRLTSPGPQVPQ